MYLFSLLWSFFITSHESRKMSLAFTNKSITQMLNWADWWLDEKKWWKEWCQHKQNIAIHFYPNESTTGHGCGSNTNSSGKQPRAPTLHRAPCLHADSFFPVPLVKIHQPLSLPCWHNHISLKWKIINIVNAGDFLPLWNPNTHSKMKMFSPKKLGNRAKLWNVSKNCPGH